MRQKCSVANVYIVTVTKVKSGKKTSREWGPVVWRKWTVAKLTVAKNACGEKIRVTKVACDHLSVN